MSRIIRHSGQNMANSSDKKYQVLKLPRYPFDYTYLIDFLKGYSSPRDKISRMIKKGEIIQVKKGLYVLSPEFGSLIDKKVLANLIYGPSYVSLEYALSYWGLIPEKVEEVTSMTNKRNKLFETPIGRFSYKYLENSKYWIGIERVESETGFFLIASKEKAICDRVAMENDLGVKDMEEFLESNLRLDMEELSGLDTDLLNEIQSAYRKKSVTAFYKWVSRRK